MTSPNSKSRGKKAGKAAGAAKTHPYGSLPDVAYWRRAVADVQMGELDPVVTAPFHISMKDKVATAGSCFAQHIARYLKQNGFNYLVTEPPHPMIPAELASTFNYGTFTARYGNLYTARQMLQLIQRAYGKFSPADDVWEETNGRFIDPFRPQIQPDGFRSLKEYRIDRDKHFAAVRKALETLDVFVFTFGLTETWMSREDGAVYPVCPGVSGGNFDPAKHVFHNFTADEVTRDALAFIDALRVINPKARVILTVSPVPLIATYEPRHVLVSTVCSKSILRVAAEQVIHAREGVAYFPSYEIITGDYARGSYFAADLRSVTEEGVSHVMRLFLKHYAQCEIESAAKTRPAKRADKHSAEMERLAEVNCDEEALDAENGGCATS